MRTRPSALSLLAVGSVLLGPVVLVLPARGQQTQPSTATAAVTLPFADPSFGFALQLPAGWEYDRSRFQRFKDSIGLLRGRAPGGRRTLQITVFRTFQMRPFDDWVVDFSKASAHLTQAAKVDFEPWMLPPRAGAVLTFSAKVGAVETRSHYLCVPFDPSTVWVLAYTGTAVNAAEQQQVRAEFDLIARSLEIHYDAEEVERTAPAFDRGKALLADLKRRAPHVEFDESERFYELRLRDQPIGYLQRRISREEFDFNRSAKGPRNRKPGIRVRERTWRFAADGTVWHARLDLFSTLDLGSELIESQQTHYPAPDAAPGMQPLTRTDSVMREGDLLLSSLTTSRDTSPPEPSQPIDIGPVYLDLAWMRLLPALLIGKSADATTQAAKSATRPADAAASAADTVAVAIYNSDVRALITYRIRPLGPPPGEAATSEGAYAFEVREGFIGAPSRLVTDAGGMLLQLEAGELTAIRSSPRAIESQYGWRREEVRRRFNLPAEP